MGVPFSAAFLERFEIVGLLGEGAFGVVYHARNRFLRKDVAIKALKTREPDDLARFERESTLLASLDHPAILTVHDAGIDSGRTPFLVTELVDGMTLEQRLRQGRLDVPQAIAIVAAVGGALAYAHRRDIVHRDVKPANVFLTRSGGIKLGDFGLARELGSGRSLTQAGVLVGTPDYIAPEMVEGQPAGVACDQYALAVMAYELLAGRKPFPGDNLVAILVARTQRAAPPLGSARLGLPASVESAVMRALARSPGERFPSVEAFTHQFVGAQESAPPVSLPIGCAPGPAGADPAPTRTGFEAPLARPAGRAVQPTAVIAGPGPADVVTSQRIPRIDPVAAVAPTPPAGPARALLVGAAAVAAVTALALLRSLPIMTPTPAPTPAARPASAPAASPPKVLFSDDFRGRLSMWDSEPGEWIAREGVASRTNTRRPGLLRREWLVVSRTAGTRSGPWSDYVFSVQVRSQGIGGRAGIVFDVQGDGQCEMFLLLADKNEWRHQRIGETGRDGRSAISIVRSGTVALSRDRPHDLTVIHRSGDARVMIDGLDVYRFRSPFTGGLVGLVSHRGYHFMAPQVLEAGPEPGAGEAP